MATVVYLNSIPYVIPATGETGWGQNVSNYLIAIASGAVLQLEAGNFTITNELNVGPNFGIASPYFRSGQDPAPETGVFRNTNTEAVTWRNADDTADLSLNVIGNDLYFNGVAIAGAGTVSPLTTKGDLYTFSTDNTRFPLGSNGQALTVNTSTPPTII